MAQQPSISLHVTITVAPENVSLLLSHSKPVIELVAAEDECTYVEVFESQTQRGKIKVVENWVGSRGTVEGFMQHQLTKPYYKPYEEATKPLWIEERCFEAFDIVIEGKTKGKGQ